MTKQEYDKRLATIETAYKQSKESLAIEYAKANNPYSIGDIIKNPRGSIIKIESISYRISCEGVPYCVYKGAALKKDLTPRKVQPLYDTIHQDKDVIKLN